MSERPRRGRRLRWFLLIALGAAWLGLAYSDRGVMLRVAGLAGPQVPGIAQPGPPVRTAAQTGPQVRTISQTGPKVQTIADAGPTAPSGQAGPPVVAVGEAVHLSVQPSASPPPPASEPAAAPPPGPALCTGAAVDPAVRFAHDAARQLLTVEFRNRGLVPCQLGPAVRFGSSNISDQRGDLKIPSCYQCGTTPPPAMAPVILDPGHAAALQLDWPLEAAATAGSCRDTDSAWVGIDTGDRAKPGPGAEFSLYARKLRLCPPINYGPFQLVDEVETPAPPVRLVLSADRPAYYPDEFMRLQLTAQDPGNVLAASLSACPELFLLTKVRQPEGRTQFTIAAVEGAGSAPFLASSGAPRFWQQELVPSATAKFPNEIGYFIGTGLAAEHGASYVSLCGGWQTVARSPDIETRLIETPLAQPVWGPPTNEFALALTSDRASYALGQDVPLHISCTRFGRDWAVTGSTEVPVCPVELEAVDAAGKKVPNSSTDFFIRTGHGWHGTRHVEGDAVVEWQSSLATEGHLPTRPGTYRVTAVWQAQDDDDPDAKPAWVRSPPLTVTITDKAQ